jgi:two-component system, OmpR family, response regulator
MKVLIIDDEEDVRTVAAFSLADVGGMDVVEAATSAEGVDKAAVEKPDAILLDVMMPGVDGVSTLALLKQNPDTASIPVLFLTAKAMPAEVRRLIELGARGVITKPFDPMNLAGEVRTLLEQ